MSRAEYEFDFEDRLRAINVIEKAWFNTSTDGLPANRKVNLEIVPKKDPQLAAEMAGILAIRLSVYKPDMIIGVPNGANYWAKQMAGHMRIKQATLRWQDKSAGKLRFSGALDRQMVDESEKIALVDDVFRTVGNLLRVAGKTEIAGKVVAAGVFWNRSQDNPNLDFPVSTLIDSYIPLIEDDDED